MQHRHVGRKIRGITDQVEFDLETWVTPDAGALSSEALKVYLDRKKAVEMCINGASNKAIQQTCGIGLKQATRLIKERCLLMHPDGRIYGFRGLVKSARVNTYTRKKPLSIDVHGRGGAGAMGLLLELDPDFRKKLDRKILSNIPNGELTEIKRPRATLWQWFVVELRDRGYEKRNEWPFNTQSLGYGALNRYADSVVKSNPVQIARTAGGETAVRKLRAGDGVDRPVNRPYQRIEMDAHKLDGRFCVLIPDTRDGWVPRIIHRLWVTVIIDVYTRAVLGYYLSMGREVTKNDVLRAIKSALTLWVPRKITFSSMSMAEGAGLPSILGDQFIGLCWEETSVDGALAETCMTIKEQLKVVVGSQLVSPSNSFAKRRSLDDRPFIETYFRVLGDRGLQRMSNTTGSSPEAKRGNDPDKVAVASEFQYEYLEELLQSLICNYNATPHTSLGYRSPLQMLQYLADRGAVSNKKADPNLIQSLLTYRKLCTVRGGAKEGRGPYVNFGQARYGGPALRHREDLVGKKVWIINHIEDDARVVRCTTISGELVGVLRVAPPWDKLPHSLMVRSHIKKLQTNKRIFNLGADAIRTFLAFAESQANKKLPVHPTYLEVRRILKQHAQLFEGDRAAERAMRSILESSNSLTSDEDDDLSHGQKEESQLTGKVNKNKSDLNKEGKNKTPADSKNRKLPAKRLAAN